MSYLAADNSVSMETTPMGEEALVFYIDRLRVKYFPNTAASRDARPPSR
jgi:hypothetical protein